MPLSDYKPYLTNLVTGLAGSAAGGGMGYFGSKPMEDEDEQSFKSRRNSNMWTGALSGGAVGAVTPTLLRPFIPEDKSWLSSIVGAPTDAAGSVVGMAMKPPVSWTALGMGGGASAGLLARSKWLSQPIDTLKGKFDDMTAGVQKLKDEYLNKGKDLETAWKDRITATDRLASSKELALKNIIAQKLPAGSKTLVDATAEARAARAHYEEMLQVHPGLNQIHTDPNYKPYLDWQSHVNDRPATLTDAEGALKKFKGNMEADKPMSWRKLVPGFKSPAERALIDSKQMGLVWRAPRMGARAGGVLGLGAGLWASDILK